MICHACDGPCDGWCRVDEIRAAEALHDTTLSSEQERAYLARVKAESGARSFAHAIIDTGRAHFEVDADDAFLAEVRATLDSAARWTSDPTVAAAIRAITVVRAERRAA